MNLFEKSERIFLQVILILKDKEVKRVTLSFFSLIDSLILNESIEIFSKIQEGKSN